MANSDNFEPFDRAMRRRVRNRAAAGYEAYAFLKEAAAEDLAARAAGFDRRWEDCLDLGAHDGRLGRRIPAERTVFADASTSFARAAGGVVCDEDRLPFADESFDLVVSALSLHGVNDLPGALVQIRRALRPGGVFLASLIGGTSAQTVRQALLEADLEESGEAAARMMPMVDPAEMPGLLQRAGFADPVVDTATQRIGYREVGTMRADLRGMGETNMLAARDRRPLGRRHAARMMAAIEELRGDDGRIPVSVGIVTLTGLRPEVPEVGVL